MPAQMNRRRRQPIIVSDRMQSGYQYERVAPMGRNFHPEFRPELTPKQMLELGVFCGKDMTDTRDEFPSLAGSLAPSFLRSRRDCSLNFFGVDASQRSSRFGASMDGIHADDPRGWFQWYCRYYMGRRLPEEDKRQINRWKAMRRHIRPRSNGTVNPAIWPVAVGNGRPSCTGLTIAGKSDCRTPRPHPR